jgi:hypothetical protein
MAITLDGTNGITTPALENDGVTTVAPGSASAPAITTDGDTNTGIFFPAADTIAFAEGGAEAMRIDSSGNVGIGTTSPGVTLDVRSAAAAVARFSRSGTSGQLTSIVFEDGSGTLGSANTTRIASSEGYLAFSTGGTSGSTAGGTERARITSAGDLLVGKTVTSFSTAGTNIGANASVDFVRSAACPVFINRLTDDGNLVEFYQATTQEGSISVSGSTVSYNGGHLARWAQTTTAKDESLKKGTVLSNLDEMNVYVDADGNPVENEQLNKVKVSDVEGDANVAGVFVNWTYDEAHQVDEINMAMTGDMIIRIAQGTTVARGDLLMSAGDGTAKPQGDDIVRSKTIAKVTSTHVTCTYDDGSYCVPCVLMAC